MRWTYPAAFVAMAIEGALSSRPPGLFAVVGAAALVAAKALKYWAISSLGPRWTFRVLVPPDTPLVTSGPYTVLQHPNYVGVMGELIGMAMLVGARVTGPVVTILLGLVLRQRIRIENDALRHPPCT
jgi:methyltransferase